MRNVEKPITHTTFSLKPFILYIITKTVRFQFSQASITGNTSLVNKDFVALIPDSPSRRDSGEKIFLDLFSLFSDI